MPTNPLRKNRAFVHALPLALLLAAFSGPAASPVEAGGDPYARLASRLSAGGGRLAKRKVAVLPFRYVDKRSSSDGEVVSERVLTRLAAAGRLEVVERALLQKVLGELKLQQSGAVDDGSAKSLGRILGVEALVTGTLTARKSGDIEVNARLIRTDTAAILATASEIVVPDWESSAEPQKAAPAPAVPAREERPARPAAPAVLPAAGPERWWHADGRTEDSVSGERGFLFNGASYGEGVTSQAFLLNGKGGYFTTPADRFYDALFDGRHPFTVAFWLRRLPKASRQGIFAKGPDPFLTALVMNGDSNRNSMTFSIKEGGDRRALVVASEAPGPAVGEWEFWALTYDGSGRAAGVNLYRDGESQPLRIHSDSFRGHEMSGLGGLEFGRLHEIGSSDGYLHGLFDDIRVFSRELTDKQVALLGGAWRAETLK